MKDKKPIDWERISWHKFASAIEILHLSAKFRQDKESHLELIRHSLMEYNYGAYIRGIAKQSGGLSKINASINLIEIGGLKKSILPIEMGQLEKFCAFFNAQRNIDKSLNNPNHRIELQMIKKTGGQNKIKLDQYLNKIKYNLYYFQRSCTLYWQGFLESKIVTAIKRNTDTKIILLAFKILPGSGLSLICNDKDIEQLIANRGSSV